MEQIAHDILAPQTFNNFTPIPTQQKSNKLLWVCGGIALLGLGLYIYINKKKEKNS
jgi:hypothetical protein